jgi:hypothetical protein
MTRSIYTMPITTDTSGKYPQRIPKYRNALFPTLGYSMFDYGNEPWCLIAIQDVPPATDAALTGNADVFELPANLDQTMGTTGVRNTVRTKLENVNIPGTWVQTTSTYREVVRFIGAVCQFAERYQGMIGNGFWFTGGVTLDSTFGSLPANVRQTIVDAAATFGFDTSGFTGASTLRAVIQSAGQQYVAAGLPLDLEGPL